MDAFYASVEALDDPTLIGKPFGVGHGVLTTANYEARKWGVRSGMASTLHFFSSSGSVRRVADTGCRCGQPTAFIAKKLCPNLTIVSNHFSRYSEKSKVVMEVLKKYDPDMCIMSVDEAYLTCVT